MFSQAPNELYYTVEKPDISSFYPFSPAAGFHHDSSLHDIFIPAAGAAADGPAAVAPDKTPSNGAAPPGAGRRRPTRKDRHSKIYTAQGPRDRRMRLSLDVARKFFDLQDLLGFDKASKTVQWLLSMSKAAIKDLVGAASKCAVVSSSEGEEDISTASASAVIASELESNAKPKGRILRPRPTAQVRIARESREKARARARERTLEKKLMRREANGVQPVRPGGGFMREEYSSSHDLKSSLDFVAEMEENCATSPVYGKVAAFGCDQQTVVGLFQEPWDQMSAFGSGYMDEKVLVGEGLLLQMFDHV